MQSGTHSRLKGSETTDCTPNHAMTAGSVVVGGLFTDPEDLLTNDAPTPITATLDPSRAIFVPRGVGNSFQALEDGTAYTYLVDKHWSAELRSTYTFVNLADPELAIEWPIPLSECVLSEADRRHPMLADVAPMGSEKTLVTGCKGQLGRAVRAAAEARGLMGFEYTDVDEFDFSDPEAYGGIDWDLYGTVVNCGAYTAVDAAETEEGRVACWRANATGPALLAKACAEHGITLVHVSCVLSSLVEPLPSRICEPLPVTRRRAPDGVRHDEVSHSRHRNPSRSRHAAPPPMRAWRTRHDSPLNCTSLPWWTTLSITAAAIWSSPKTLPHMLNSRLVVNTTDWRS